MNIIISAEKGDRVRERAQDVIARYVGAPSFERINPIDVYKVLGFKDLSNLVQALRNARPAVVYFPQGAINTPKEMLIAVDAVKRYREQTARPHVLAVYVTVEDEGAVVLTAKATKASLRRSAELTVKDLLDATDGVIHALAGLNEEQLTAWGQIRALQSLANEDRTLNVIAYDGLLGYVKGADDVAKEVQAQNTKFGENRDQPLATWLGILNEEVLEFTREVVTLITEVPKDRAKVLAAAREELVQVAAVSMQILNSYFDREKRPDRSLEILTDLWLEVWTKHPNQRDNMIAKLVELLPADAPATDVECLSVEDRGTIHNYLLSVLHD